MTKVGHGRNGRKAHDKKWGGGLILIDKKYDKERKKKVRSVAGRKVGSHPGTFGRERRCWQMGEFKSGKR